MLRSPEAIAEFGAASNAGKVLPACGVLGQNYGNFLSTLEAYALRRAAVPFERQHLYQGRALGMRWQIVTRPAHRQRWELTDAARWGLWWGGLKNLQVASW